MGHVGFASTGGAIYGEVASGAADEQTPKRPYSPYATSKFAFERCLDTYPTGEPAVRQRVRAPDIIHTAKLGWWPSSWRNCVAVRQCRSTLSTRREMTTACAITCLSVTWRGRTSRAAARGETPTLLSLGTGQATSTRELAEALAVELSVTPHLTPAAPRAGDLSRSVLDSARATALLGG